MGTPADFITAGGSGIWNELWGKNAPTAGHLPAGSKGFFGWADPSGGSLGAENLVSGALKNLTLTGGIAPTSAYNQQTGGLSVPTGANPGLLQQMLQNSSQRFFGKGQPGQAGYTPDWSQNFEHWFGTDVTGPDGKTLYSPRTVAGNQLNADFSGDKGAAGNIVNTLIGAQKIGKAQQPNVTEAIQFMRGVDATSPYQIRPGQDYANMMTNQQNRGPNVADVTNKYLPKIGQYTDQQGNAIGSQAWQGAGNVKSAVDPYTGQIQGLQNDYETQLLKDIDTKANISLDDSLQGTSAALQAAGLGRSGAGQQALAGELEKIKGQQARDKIAAMSSFKENALNRIQQGMMGAQQAAGQGALQAQDITGRGQLQGMDIGGRGLLGGMDVEAQQQQSRQNELAQALMGGLNNEFQGGQQMRTGEQEMMNQQLQRMMTERMGQEQNLLTGLTQAGQLGLQENLGQANVQNMGMQNLMNQFSMRENYRGTQMDELMRNAAAEQAQRQAQTTGSTNAMMMPMQLMMNLMGMSGPASPANPGFADMLLGSAARQVGQGVGQAANGYIGNVLFGG